MNYCILGAGAWGTAVAIHLERMGHNTSLVPRRSEHAAEIVKSGENRAYLPGFPIGSGLRVTADVEIARECDVVFLAAPSKGLRCLCETLRDRLGTRNRRIVYLALCKGLEAETNLAPSAVIGTVFPESVHGTVSGPTYAGEVAAGRPAAVVLAVNRESESSRRIPLDLSNEQIRVYTSDDLPGVELGACLKNIYAIAAGICDGFELGDNAKAALITRSVAEMVRLGVSLGGEAETFYGLSGFGDLIATCNGSWSRNRGFGQQIAEGVAIMELIETRKMTVEGYGSTECFFQICRKNGLDAPILVEIHKVLFGGKDCRASIRDLMTRQLKPESC